MVNVNLLIAQKIHSRDKMDHSDSLQRKLTKNDVKNSRNVK